MARKSKKQTGTKPSNESVIASRVLQDIINNSSESFRRYLESQGGGAQALAGGGTTPPNTWDIPGMGPPVQGPPAPPLWQPPAINNFDRQLPTPGIPGGVPMPGVQAPNIAMPMPGGPISYEDGSMGPAYQTPFMLPQQPQPKSLTDLMRMLGMI